MNTTWLMLTVVPGLLTFAWCGWVLLDILKPKQKVEAFWGAFFLAWIWPVGLVWTTLLVCQRRRNDADKYSWGERRAIRKRRIAEEGLTEAKALKERERVLGL